LKNHYFDITTLFTKPAVDEVQVKEDSKMAEMKKFLDTLIDEIEKDKKQVD
jgi:hypothetical protein